MKKISQRVLAAAVVVAAGASASAEVLSPEQALDRALPQARMAAPGLARGTQLAFVENAADELPAVYVFAKENKGFMLISADDVVAPLLGYVKEGNFDADNMAPAFKYWMGEYARQIAYARENNATAPLKASIHGRAEIAPMVKTRWNQDAPYNDLCPKGRNDARTYTGCVATAAAQVMKYFSYPQGHGKGVFSYVANVDGTSMELSIDVPDVELKWDLMADTYNRNSSDESKLAVAELMRLIGYGVDMNYSTSGSGAQTYKVGKIFAENFFYDKSVEYIARNCYTLNEWENIIYNQLATVGPVLYDGSTINNEGHAFVCDGYQEQTITNADTGEQITNNYFHINWGWGGTSDGYFLIGTLDPATQGAGGAASGEGFDYGQNATINLMPDKGGEVVPRFEGSGSGLVITPGDFNLGTEVTVGMKDGGFYNYNYAEVDTVKFGLHIVGAGQDMYRWSTTLGEDLATLYGVRSYNVLLSNVKPNSEYILTPAFKCHGKIYDMSMPYGQTRAYVLKTRTHNGSLTPVGYELRFDKFDCPDVFPKALRREIKATITNPTDQYYYGHIAPAMLKKEYGEYSVVKMFVNETLNVDAGETIQYVTSARFTKADGLEEMTPYYMALINPETLEIMSDIATFYYGSKPDLGITDATGDDNAVMLTPNPADSYFTVIGADVNTVKVYNLAGGLAAKANKATVDVADLATGVYLVEVVDNNGARTVLRLIKK